MIICVNQLLLEKKDTQNDVDTFHVSSNDHERLSGMMRVKMTYSNLIITTGLIFNKKKDLV